MSTKSAGRLLPGWGGRVAPRPAILLAFVGVALAACGGGGSSTQPPPVSTNTAPTISGTPPVAVNAGETYTFAPSASDADGDTLTWSISNAPGWAMFDTDSGELSGTPFSGDVGEYADIMITVSDGKASTSLPAYALAVLTQKLGESNFSPEGQVTPTDDGYESVGDLELNTGERVQRFEDADVTLTFDDDGKLVDFEGETLLPANPTDNVSIDSPVRAVVGMLSGAEINADPDFGIALQPTTDYFVFYLGVSVDITIGDRNDPTQVEHLTLETPAAGQLILIMDPTDPFLYRYGSQPLIGAYGKGESDSGLIPFVPSLDYPELDAFNGNTIDKGSMGIGFKIFDFFELEGTRVIHEPSFFAIDWDDPLHSLLAYKAGLNGDASFSFSILSVGLFSFDLAKTSASLDVNLTRQNVAMQTIVEPDISWVPSWFPFVPSTQVIGDWFFNGDGDYSASLSGMYHSDVPEADIAGSMELDNDGAILTGTTGDGRDKLSVSAEFRNSSTTARIEFSQDVAAGIDTIVLDAVDREIDAAQQALDDLQSATADYEFEVSLRGLRSSLPTIADTAIAALNAVPGEVRTAVDNATVSYINSACTTVIVEICLSDLVNANSIGNSTGETARGQAATAIVPYVASMQELKNQAQNGDDESLRDALESALRSAYDHAVFSKKFTINYSFPSPFGSKTVYNSTYTKRVIPVDTANQILAAADNVYRIQETSDIMVSAQSVYDAFPTDEVLQQVRSEVEDGVAEIPSVDGAGVTIAGSQVDAFVTLDGSDYPVSFNVLSPAEAVNGVGELIADQLLDK